MPDPADRRCQLYEGGIIIHRLSAYLLSVTAASVIAAIVKQLSADKTPGAKLIGILAGVFVCITAVSPVIQLDLSWAGSYITDFQANAEEICQSGVDMAQESMAEIIKKNTQAYILQRAQQLGMELDVQVLLTDTDPPVPYAVTLQGAASPYQKKVIGQFINQYLDISQEHQQWI